MNQSDERNSLVPAPYAHLGPSAEMTILRPIFGRGLAQRRWGAEVPELHQKLPLISLDPPPLKMHRFLNF